MKTSLLKQLKKNKIPEPDAICGNCGRPIYLKNEVDGLLYISKGKPICIPCRVLRGKTKGSRKTIKDRNQIKVYMQNEANENVENIAIEINKDPRVQEVSLKNFRNDKGKQK